MGSGTSSGPSLGLHCSLHKTKLKLPKISGGNFKKYFFLSLLINRFLGEKLKTKQAIAKDTVFPNFEIPSLKIFFLRPTRTGPPLRSFCLFLKITTKQSEMRPQSWEGVAVRPRGPTSAKTALLFFLFN